MASDPTRTHTPPPAGGGADELTVSTEPVTSGDRIPTTVGRYELLEEIGQGGMGVVFRARDTALDRDVAVKILPERYPVDSPASRRFVDEARITAQLQHPGIPPVFEVGALADGRPFLAMKLIKGRTLEALLRERSDLTADRGRFLAAFEQVCQALAYVHSRRVIHRDLKPANVMVGAFGEIQVMDWGLAKVIDPARPAADRPAELESTDQTQIRPARDVDSATEAGSLLGTPAFMPPEQAGGEADKVDARSDVFGLGAILCVILTGKPPYTGPSSDSIRLAAIRGQLADAFARLDGCGAEPRLIALARRCLAAEPAERPGDAGAVAEAVRALRADAEQRARQAELDRVAAEVQAAEQRKRRRVQLALAAAVLLLAAGGGGGAWWADRQAAERQGERQLEAARNSQAAELALDQAEQALRKENPIYGEIDAALAQAERRLADAGPAGLRDRLAALARARHVLTRLDDIDYQRWLPSEYDARRPDAESARRAFPEAFREYGLDATSGPPEVVAECVIRSPIAARLTAALDDWLGVAQAAPAARLLAVLDRLDPDEKRGAVRRALATRDRAMIGRLVSGLDGAMLPPAFAAFVGGHGLSPGPDALRILKAAQAAHPDDFGLACRTADRLARVPGRARERAGYLRAALAVRPGSPRCLNGLGLALMHAGDSDGAMAVYRQAIHLHPAYAPPHTNLGIILLARNDLDGSMKEFREGARLNPVAAPPHAQLGRALERAGDRDGAMREFREAIRLEPRLSVGPYLRLARLLHQRGEDAAAVGVCRDAARANPGWMENATPSFRYNSACYACLAAVAQGNGVPRPDDRQALRRQALDWLTADLAALRALFEADPAKNRALVHRRAAHYQTDADLSSVRDGGALSPEERNAWKQLWATARKLHDDSSPASERPGPAPK